MPEYTPYPRTKGHSGIYEIHCIPTGKSYIGSAQCLRHRRTDHLHLLRHNKHHSVHLQRAWNLYGADAFEFRVLELCSIDQLMERERFYIETVRPELNIAIDPTAPMKGRKKTAESVEKGAAKLRGRKNTAEHNRRISEAHKGKKTSEAHKESIRQTFEQKGTVKGANNPRAKLTTEQVVEIRNLHASGISGPKLAEMYKTSHSLIYAIVHHKAWKDIP